MPAMNSITQATQANQKHSFDGARSKNSPFKRLTAKIWDILKEKDPPHRIALGLALGIFIGILPIMGIQMAVVTLFAIPLRGNLKAALAGVWISNPVTFLPIYWANYLFGTLFFSDKTVSWERFVGEMARAAEWDWTALKASLTNLVHLGAEILVPLWVGSVILATVLGIVTYFVTLKWVTFYRNKVVIHD